MEATPRSALLSRRAVAGALVTLGAACAFVAACGPHAVKAPPALADALERMAPQAQLDTLRALSAVNPGDAELAFHTGNAYYSLGMEIPPERGPEADAYYDSATTAYRRATELDSTYSRAYVNMGLAYDAWRKRSDARSAFVRALEINPRDVLAYCHLGYLEYTLGNKTAAMDYYQRALAVDPDSPQAHYNLGLAFAEANIFHEALREWERVAALDPDGQLGKMAGENVRIIRQYLADEAPQTP